MVVAHLLVDVVEGVEGDQRTDRVHGHTRHAANVAELKGVSQPTARVQQGGVALAGKG